MDILVYTPTDSSNARQILEALRPVVTPLYTVGPITAQSLATQPWGPFCSILIIPSIDEGDQPHAMSQPANQAIQQYLAASGPVLLLGAGASISAVRGPADALELWDSKSKTALKILGRRVGDQHPAEGTVHLSTGETVAGLGRTDAKFSVLKTTAWKAIGRWESPVDNLTVEEGETESVAGIELPVDNGFLHFWDVSLSEPSSPAGVHSFLRKALPFLGLALPSPPSAPADAEAHAPGLPPVPTHPLPQFLLAPPSKPYIVEQVISSIGLKSSELISAGRITLVDAADTFQFHYASPSEASELLNDARGAVWTAGAAKDVLVLPPGIVPPTELTPRFDVGRYFNLLLQAHQSAASGAASSAESWGIGEALLYAEAVTSTQTMLDKNPRLLTSLPIPLVSLASFQLAGRGRGSNTWLSPTGCLQFSLLLRVPLASFPAGRLVFIQYLFGLAVVAAAQDPRALGGEGSRVRLKWPNDVYVETPAGEKKKIGGILVNTSFQGGEVDIVIGCGLNISTPAPITSLSVLATAKNPVSTESMLALILSKFERMWITFLRDRGSWAPFADDYLDAWMHSDQLVTVSTISPPRAVRIVGITHDHGLLRTIPERSGLTRGGSAADDEGYIDLQPDGNSFDLMAGLIKAKA